MKYAPIFVSVFDRPYHFKACIESLAKNEGAENTLLFVSSDGPKDEASSHNVKLVRDYINNLKFFKKVISFCPAENTAGHIKSQVYERIKSDFSRYIRSEDDNVFSPYALNYFNEGLEIFETAPDVHAICGYMFPNFPFKHYNQTYLRCFNGWGAAFWRDKDMFPNFDQRGLSAQVLSNKNLFKTVNKLLPHVVPMTHLIKSGKLNAVDVTRCNYIIKNDQVCVFPSISLVRNIGHDGTGSHCGTDAAYEKQRIAEKAIQFDTLKPRKPKRNDERWVTNFFGGKKLALRNKFLFSHPFSENYYFCILVKFIRLLRG